MIVACPQCEALVDCEEVGHLEFKPSDDLFDLERYAFLKCARCGRPLLTLQGGEPVAKRRWNESKQTSDETWEIEWGDPVRVYPAPDRRADFRLPKALRACFDEALGCLRSNLYDSTALMCRKTLEGICQLKGASGSLARGLQHLHEDGIIDRRLFEWAEALREDGNLAAHDLDVRVSREDAKHIVDFTEAILEYVFILGEEFKEYQALRENRSSPKTKSSRGPSPPRDDQRIA